jgi:hypothetical protein
MASNLGCGWLSIVGWRHWALSFALPLLSLAMGLASIGMDMSHCNEHG